MKSISRLIALLVSLALLLSACGGTATPPATAPTAAPAAADATAAPAAAPEATAAPAAAEATAAPAAAADATTAPAPAAGGERTKITYWFPPPEQGTDCFVDTVIAKFNEQSKTVEIEAISTPNAWDATRTAIAGGAGPDIVQTPGPSFVFELAKAGQLLPLDDYVAKYNWQQSITPWALSLGKVDGKLYSLPDEVETLVLYYNKTLFAEKGWTPPKTLDDLVALAAQVKAAGLIPFGHANSEWRPANEWFVGEFLNHVAGPQKVYEALTGKISWDDPDFEKAIGILNDMQQQGYFMGGLDRYYTATSAEAHTAFGDGKAAMNIEGSWFVSDIGDFFGEKANNANDWDWVPMPSANGDAIFDLGIGSTFSINKNTKSPDATAEFLNYYFSTEAQAALLSACGKAPAPVELKAETLKEIDPRHALMVETLGKAAAANNYGYTTWTFWPPKSDVYIYEQVEKVWSKEITPKEYLEGLQKLFAEELQAGNIPPIPAR
jgi:raffinose/stachyose/melibiose transport system substrate-binding protein